MVFYYCEHASRKSLFYYSTTLYIFLSALQCIHRYGVTVCNYTNSLIVQLYIIITKSVTSKRITV